MRDIKSKQQQEVTLGLCEQESEKFKKGNGRKDMEKREPSYGPVACEW